MAEMEHLVVGKPALRMYASNESDERNDLARRLLPADGSLSSKKTVYAVVALQVALVAFLLVCAFVDIQLAQVGSFSTTAHALYITGTTIIATAIASFTVGQTRRLWLDGILTTPSSGIVTTSRSPRRTKTLLSLGSLRDAVTAWDVTVSFLVVSLITTSIVSGITPSQTLRTFESPAVLVVNDTSCFTISAVPSNQTKFNWRLDNGSYIGVNSTFDGFCSLSNVQRQLQDVVNTPSGWAYAVGATPIDHSAIGAPNQGNGGFGEVFGPAWIGEGVALPEFESAQGCFPVVTTNPVICRPGGVVSTGQNDVTVTAGNCSVTTPVYSIDPTIEGASAAGVCTDGHSIGTATILFGSVNDQAAKLARTLWDVAWLNATPQATSYAVTCTVDMTSVLGFRNVSYSRLSNIQNQYDDFAAANGASAAVVSDAAPCEMIDAATLQAYSLEDFLTVGALSAGAGASWELLTEGEYRDGWWDTLWQAAMFQGGNYFFNNLDSSGLPGPSGSTVFNDSKNSLEDALGLASALALGMYYGGNNEGDEPLRTIATTTLNGTRMGTGHSWAVVYIVPELFTTALLIVLLRRKRRLAS